MAARNNRSFGFDRLRLESLWDRLWSNYWFLPGLMTVAAGLMALGRILGGEAARYAMSRACSARAVAPSGGDPGHQHDARQGLGQLLAVADEAQWRVGRAADADVLLPMGGVDIQVLQFDAAPPPLAKHARSGCASTLAFEFSHGPQRLIVNCGGAGSSRLRCIGSRSA